jgi:thioredoxin reductase (NADPH)
MKRLSIAAILLCIGTKGNLVEHTQHHELIIIGSGPAGLTAAIYAGRSKLNPIVIAGQPSVLATVADIENWPCHDHISGTDLITHMTNHAQQAGAHIIHDEVEQVTITQRPFTITTKGGTMLRAKALIIATGMCPKKIGCPGEHEYFGQGVAYCALCDAPLFQDRHVVIVGGGMMALHNATLLSKYAKKVTILNNKTHISGPPELVARVENAHNIETMPQCTVTQILGNEHGVTGIEFTDTQNTTHTLTTDGVFISLGYEPCTDIFKHILPTDHEGRIKTNSLGHTRIEGIFAAGNASTIPHGQAIICASSGCIAAIEAEKYLGQRPTKTRLFSCQKS